ncbi:VWA domain-containing protein [Methanocella sp. MCL-LM]|uniref:VWA domain-containing protein n=1 Tax=Methanocella sp. MCL-LM TaxID=3412035 RepID=UPI003C722E0C
MTRLSRHIVLAMAIAIITCIVAGSTVTYAGEVGSPTVIITTPAKMTAGTTASADVYLVDSNNNPVSGAFIIFTCAGEISATPTSATTDSSGRATTSITAGPGAGTASLTAAYSSISATKEISVNGPPVKIDVTSEYPSLPAPPTLMPAGRGEQVLFLVQLKDANDNPCNNTPVFITINDKTVVATTDVNGRARGYLGPASESCRYNVTVATKGVVGNISESFSVYFLEPQVIFEKPDSVTAGTAAEIKATVIDHTYQTPVQDLVINFTVYSPGSLATPSSYSGCTDENGTVLFSFNTSPKAGVNTVLVSNDRLGDIDSTIVMGMGGSTSNIVLVSTPESPIIADGTTHYKLRMWARDGGGNPVKGDTLNITKNGVLIYVATTNFNGYAEMDISPSIYVGSLLLTVESTSTHASNTITLDYVADSPAKTVIKANPGVIASSDVEQPEDMEDVHTTQLLALVTDKYDHPLPNQYINIYSLNLTAGNITGPASGYTDLNGEFYTNFTLGKFSEGTGNTSVNAESGTLSSTFKILYTNVSFISTESTITPRNVSVNDTINVGITLKGLGWNSRVQPVDVMLVTDRSGSMNWCANTVYPTDKQPKQGTLTRNSYYTVEDEADEYNDDNRDLVRFEGLPDWYPVATYVKTGSSPFSLKFNTASSDSSYTYYMKVVDPTGKTYVSDRTYPNVTTSQSQKYNTITFNAPVAGEYKVYGLIVGGNKNSYTDAIVVTPQKTTTVSTRRITSSTFNNHKNSVYYNDAWGLANSTRWEYIDTYNNDNTKVVDRTVQIMLSSPYTNYSSNYNGFSTGSYYNLMVEDPNGNRYVSTGAYPGVGVSTIQSANENFVQFTNAVDGAYKIYGMQMYNSAKGEARYNMMVLTLPLRLGPKVDVTSAAKTGAIQFISNMSSEDKLGVVSFNTDYYSTAGFKLMTPENKNSTITAVKGLSASGGTQISEGMAYARDQLVRFGRSEYRDYMIILTDGYSQSPTQDRAEATSARNAGITIFTIGMGMADQDTLREIANTTGGTYYNVTSDVGLAKAYRQIGTQIKDVIANETSMTIISNRTMINGTIVSDAEYVNNSAWVTFANGTRAQIEPIVTMDSQNYSMYWEPGQIHINDVWQLDYKMKAMHGGTIVPVTNRSYVSYIRDNKTVYDTFTENSIYCSDDPNSNATGNSTAELVVEIITPADNQDLIEEYQQITWNVLYSGPYDYTQVIYLQPEGGAEAELKKGFAGNNSTTSTYSTQWNLKKLPAGNYKIRIEATDGANINDSQVKVSIPANNGKIILH